MHKRAFFSIAAAIAVASSGLVALQGATPDTAGAATVSPLPFDLPSTEALRSSPRKVFGHYFTPYPISLDNQDPAGDYYARNYLKPTGESGKHAAYGGLLRDRPTPRPVSTNPAWALEDMKTEVRNAIAAGLDGFTLDLLGGSGQNWDRANLLMRAATAVDPGFKIVLMPDANGSMTSDVNVLADRVATLAKYPSAHRQADGRLTVSPFKTEGKSVTYWKTFISLMKNKGVDVAFYPTFLNYKANADAYAPISMGFGNWGNRNPAGNQSAALGANIADAHARGKKWMQPVSFQDERPNQGIYDEAANTENLRLTWQATIDHGADWVQMITWNDYSEGTQFQPSAKRGWSSLDISAYYIAWWKTGVRPALKRDALYLTHRTQPYAAKPTFAQTRLMALRGGSTPARNTVEALAFLPTPATVSITVGAATTTCNLPAGVQRCLTPLADGNISARIVRSGGTTTAVTSPFRSTSTPYVQDLQYVAAASRRQGTVASAPVVVTDPPPSPTPVVVTDPPPTSTDTVVTMTPLSDTYVDSAAPTTNFGGSLMLAAEGSPTATSYLRFRLPATPAGKTLVGATLSVRTTTHAGAGTPDAPEIRIASDAWSNPGTTYATRPAVTATRLGAFAPGSVPDTVYTATLDHAALRALGGTQQTIAITGASDNRFRFWSTNVSDDAQRPRLRLVYR